MIVQAGLNNIRRIYVIPIGDCITDIASRVIHEYQDKLYRILRIQDTGDHLNIHSKKEFTSDLAGKRGVRVKRLFNVLDEDGYQRKINFEKRPLQDMYDMQEL